MNKPPVSFYQVKIGILITPKFDISKVHSFQCAKEYEPIFSKLLAGAAQLDIVEKFPLDNRTPIWLKVSIEGTSPKQVLKISGQEYLLKFLMFH